MSQKEHTRNTILSIILACAAFLMFSTADACVKYLGNLGYTNAELLTYASIIAITFAVLYISFRKGHTGFLPKKSIKLHLVRVISIATGTYFIIAALRILPLAEFYAIVFLIPFLVALSSAIIFKEHVGLYRWIAIIGGFSGVLVAVSGNLGSPSVPPIGILYALASACCITVSYMVVRLIGPGEYGPLFPLYSNIMIFIVNIGFAWPDLSLPPTHEIPVWLLYGSCIFFAVLMVSLAYTKAPVAAIPAPFQYTQIIWGVLFGYFMFQEIPQTTTITGICIIVSSGMFMIWREYKSSRTPAIPKIQRS